LRAFFLSADGRLRRFLPSRLPRHETAFAMTVHKSQGSEFSEMLLLLPESDTPLLTRELLYTALTRARVQVEVWATEPVLRAAITRRVTRVSGLRDALRAESVGSRQSGSNR
ncbi:MAG: ATP-binding domain-containing protein, partial [Chthoniobacterales bacterium]